MLEEQIKGYEKQLSDLKNEITFRNVEIEKLNKKIEVCKKEQLLKITEKNCIWITDIFNMSNGWEKSYVDDCETSCGKTILSPYDKDKKICQFCGKPIIYINFVGSQ